MKKEKKDKITKWEITRDIFNLCLITLLMVLFIINVFRQDYVNANIFLGLIILNIIVDYNHNELQIEKLKTKANELMINEIFNIHSDILGLKSELKKINSKTNNKNENKRVNHTKK